MQKAFSVVREVWEGQLKDIATAQHSVYFEQYLLMDLAPGEIGKRYIDALCERASAGIEVKCIFDSVASRDLFLSTELGALLDKAGVVIAYYTAQAGTTKLFSPLRFILRDHRKLLVIDKRVAWIGGVVVTETLANSDDLMVRYENAEVAEACAKEFLIQFKRLDEGHKILPSIYRINSDSLLVGNAPGVAHRFVYERMCHAIMLAKESVTFVTPYFAPPPKLQNVILRQLKNGITITLLTPRKTDNTLADEGREAILPKLIERGLQVRYLEKMNHAKILLSDDLILTYGSTNLDSLSLIYNHELNLETKDTELIGEVREIIREWAGDASVIKADECEYYKYSFFKKVRGHLMFYWV